jgi:hypothetical protein
MLFNEPIQQRYNDLLKQRIALEGELALLRKSKDAELAIERRSRYKMLLGLLLLPLLTFLCKPKMDPSVYDRKIALQRDSIELLKSDLEKSKQKSFKYVVKKGDMLVTLGQLFFNDAQMGYKIGQDNGFTSDEQHKKLVIGDTLTIKIP